MEITIFVKEQKIYKDNMAIHLEKKENGEYRILEIEDSYIPFYEAEEIISSSQDVEDKIIEKIYKNDEENILQIKKVKAKKGKIGTRYSYYEYIKSENEIKIIQEATEEAKYKYANQLFELIKKEMEYTELYLERTEAEVTELENILEINFLERERYSENKNLIFNIKVYSIETPEEFEKLSEKEKENLIREYNNKNYQDMLDKIREKSGIGIKNIFSEGRSGGWLVIESDEIPALHRVSDKKELIKERMADVDMIKDKIEEDLKYGDIYVEGVIEEIIEEMERLYNEYNEEIIEEEIYIEEIGSLETISESIKTIEQIINECKYEYEKGFSKFIEEKRREDNKNKRKTILKK